MIIIKIYLLICLYNILLFVVNSYLNRNEDVFKVLNEINEIVEKLRKDGADQIANMFENMINSALYGNPMPLYIFIFTMYIMPIINIMVAISTTKDILKKLKTKDK